MRVFGDLPPGEVVESAELAEIITSNRPSLDVRRIQHGDQLPDQPEVLLLEPLHVLFPEVL